MRTAVYAALTVTILAASSAFGAGAKQATTRGSFLRYRANSAQELASMVKRDPSLATRYARHFGSTNYGVSDYFGKRLTLIRLKKPSTNYVYYYDSRGHVTRGQRVMPAGTLVFATQSGEPVLDWRCGNPLRSSLPIRQATKRDDKTMSKVKMAPLAGTEATGTKSVKVAAAPPDADTIVEKVLAAAPAEFAPIATIAPASLETTVAAGPLMTSPMIPTAAGAALPPIAEVAVIPALSAISSAPVIAAASHAFSWLLPMAALGGGVAVASNKRGDTHEVTPPPAEPVPEPGALLPLAASFATAGTAILKKRRSFLRN